MDHNFRLKSIFLKIKLRQMCGLVKNHFSLSDGVNHCTSPYSSRCSPKDTMGPLRVVVSLLLLFLPLTSICAAMQETSTSQCNDTSSCKQNGSGIVECKAGIVLPVWLPLNPSPREQAGRAIIYFLSLMYLFVGVSIIADRFMASIEVITSQVPLLCLYL